MINQLSERRLTNPILSGFYPDPSICRVGADFYLVNSSFELFPGLPIFHSRDLVHWRQIGHALDRPSQVYLKANSLTGGLMAPTIRYHNGVFYIINANFCDAGNYLIKAENPAGPWSDPYWLNDITGIDASLFFDEDGRCYITGTGTIPSTGERGIYICEFDAEKMEKLSPKQFIWNHALHEAASPEAPHLYKKDGWYYLVIAEGGTEHNHAVTVARSRDLFSWFQGNPANPILTHRHLGQLYPICNAGHADFVETSDGNWYAVLLASRLIDGYYKNLGRETFFVPVEWEKDWPVMSPGTGKIERSYDAPILPPSAVPILPEQEHFDHPKLSYEWFFWGTPYYDFWKIENSCLMLRLLPRSLTREVEPLRLDRKKEITEEDAVSFIGRRQTHIHFDVSCMLTFVPQANHETAGLIVMQAANHHYRLEKTRGEIRLVLVKNDMSCPPHFPQFRSRTTEEILARAPYFSETIILKLSARGQRYTFYYAEGEQENDFLLAEADGRLINPEIIGCMIGTCLGMFASANGHKSENWAAFDWFNYKGWDQR